jgi:flagellar basal-body rod protein FlgB
VELFDPTLVGLERAMSGAMLRQQVVANNLANANTPNYKRADVDFQSVLARAFDRGSSAGDVSQVAFTPATDPAVVRADGSGDDVDTEMSTLSQNALAYTAFSSVAAARVKILRTAIGVA